MAPEISGFEGRLADLAEQARDLNKTEAMDLSARWLQAAYAVRLWFAEVLGHRWSFVAGVPGDEPVTSELRQVRLGPQTGLVVQTWGSLSEPERRRVVGFLGGMLATKKHADA